MNTKELKIYLNSLSFGVKNFDKTSDKYKNYKNDKFNALIRAYNNGSNDFMSMFYDYTSTSMWFDNAHIEARKDGKKSTIRMFKTAINYRMKEALGYFVSSIFEYEEISLNDNEKKVLYNKILFTIL